MGFKMKDLNYVANEINKGKNLEMNLPKFANSMMSLYNGLAYIKMSMNYYTFYETLKEKEYQNSALTDVKEYVDRLNAIIQKEVIDHGNMEATKESTQELLNIRNDIISIMEVVTSYVDKLRIYEYILNRVEYRFDEQELDEEYYNTYMTNDIMHYILSEQDNVVVNGKISEVVGQIPVRMSKGKFYEHLKDAFSIYHGAQKGTIDDFVYTIRTSSMLDTPKGFGDRFKEINEMYQELVKADYKNITQDEFKRLSGILTIASQNMTNTADLFVSLTQLINDTLTITLSKMYAFHDVEEIEKGIHVINSIYQGFCGENYNSEDDSVMEAFESFEGKQERILSVVSANEYVISLVLEKDQQSLQSLMMEQIYHSLDVITKLQSGSDFVVIDQKEDNQELASDAYIDEKCDALIQEFENFFEGCGQQVKRAVMATVLSELPVFFNNVDEIQNYINTALIQCNDLAERKACVEIFRMLLGDEA